jgi:hypothetical protein
MLHFTDLTMQPWRVMEKVPLPSGFLGSGKTTRSAEFIVQTLGYFIEAAKNSNQEEMTN